MRFNFRNSRGFTMVELLVVIVVIGILAAITLIAYNGIQTKARVTSLQSEASSINTQLQMFKVDNVGNFPTSITSCPTAVNGATCLKQNTSVSYAYAYDNTASQQSYCLTVNMATGESVYIDNDSKPLPGSCTLQSCYQVQQAGGSKGSGVYWIKPSGASASMRVYCDMVTAGGGWTLLVSNPGPWSTWDSTKIWSYNAGSPSITTPYSILNQADNIKTNIGGNLQYKVDAVSVGSWGGVWQAPYSDTLEGTSPQLDTANTQKFDAWTIEPNPADGVDSLANVIPWVSTSKMTLGMWDNVGNWWGTLVAWVGGYSPAPYISGSQPAPGVIWYWVR